MGKFWLSSFDVWNELHGPYHATYDYIQDRVHEYHHHHVEEDEEEDEHEEEHGGYEEHVHVQRDPGRHLQRW